jgi:hypothetical protein
LGKIPVCKRGQAISEKTVVVPGTDALAIVLPRLAHQLAKLRRQREEAALEVETSVAYRH